MTITRTAIAWIVISAFALLVLLFLRPILLPFAIGMALAYLLVPAVDRLEQVGINRSLAALVLVLLLVVSIAAGALVLLWAIVGELSFFIDQFPRYVARVQSLVMDASRPWLHKLIGEELHFNESSIKVATTMGSAWLHDAVISLWSSGEALISLLALLVVVPIVSIYLLADWHRTIATVDGWVPESRREVVRALRSEIRDTVAGFVRGQVVICLILAVFYAVALKIVGLNHAILIGVTAGVISFVPYLGAAAGFVVAMCVAVAQFWPDWEPMVIVGSIFLVGENLADYVLAPRIIGRRVKLNPVWLMFSLFAFGYLFGFLGLLIAIPLAASLGVILRYAMRELLDASKHNTAPTAAAGIITPQSVSPEPTEEGRSAEPRAPENRGPTFIRAAVPGR